jgi:hypothetical protein
MEQLINNRDFSSISPSAKWLLLLKGYTNIPFAREVAEMFFNDMGFMIGKGAKIKYSEMSSFKYLLKSLTLRQLFKLKSAGKKIQATWRLKAVKEFRK